MKKTVADIAEVNTGATLRDKPQQSATPDSMLMQLGDLDGAGCLRFETMTPFLHEGQFSKSIALPGDLVFRGRGAAIAVAVMSKTEKPVIVAAPLIIIRPDTSKVDPEYLAWALSATAAARHYAQFSRGSAIVGIGKRDLETLEIIIPDLQIQRKIGALKNLQARENHLLMRYKDLREKLFNSLLDDAASSAKKEKRA